MLTMPEKIVFVIVVLVSSALAFRNFQIMFKVIGRGEGKLYFKPFIPRLGKALSVLFSQKTVLNNRPLLSFFHALIAWTFILYFLVNLGDILTGYIAGFHFLGQGALGNAYRLFVDVFSVLALFAMAVFMLRRFVAGSPRLTFSDNVLLHEGAKDKIRTDSLIVGLFILLHVGFRFLGESFSIALNGPDSWQPFAAGVSIIWSGLDTGQLVLLQHTAWWLALGLIFAFLPYFPYSKHVHLFMGPLNYMTQPQRSAPGTMQTLDFEAEDAEQFGVAKLEHLEKTQILDAYACIMCNRCQDVCPAYVTGKELSPSALEVNKRVFINKNAKKLAAGEDVDGNLAEYAISESALWACTSCAACVEVCPVGNEPMYDILNMRRDKVLMESEFPKQLQGAFNGMERNQNPWNINDDRLKWAKDDPEIEVKTVDDNPDFDVLYWVGCAGAFEQKGQRIARAFTKILNTANVNFAVLGNKESCTGDSARRSGNEYLFAMMAESNAETLNAVKPKRIVATCPHCLHTLKNEYGQFGAHLEVVHHSQFIDELIESGALKIKDADAKTITFHDPCYLGRHNNEYDAPRNDLQKSGVDLVEMPRNRNRSFCCGAGGAQMWKEEEEGNDAVRRNRFKEAEKTGAEVLGTGCPFCMIMLTDAGTELESKMAVRDIAEIVADKI